MNATDIRPEVALFVARVREHLADLTEDERDELLDGLEADLSEQLAEGGSLPDPTAYAAELRAAAGLPAAGRRRLGVPAGNLLDQAREGWLGWTRHNRATSEAWTLVQALRPAWWVLRAWIAVTLLDQMVGPWEFVTLWPTLGSNLVGPVVLVAAIVVSALVGLGRLWPGAGPDRSAAARLVLLGLNVLAVLAPLTFTGDGSQQYFYTPSSSAMAGPPRGPDVLRHGPDVIRNIYAYDASGQPILGVQLFDQKGRPVEVSPGSSMGIGRTRQVTCPWVNGGTSLFNVFPLQQRTQQRGSCLKDVDPARVSEPAFAQPPLGSVPPVSLPDGTQGVSSPTGTPSETVFPSGASGQAQAGS